MMKKTKKTISLVFASLLWAGAAFAFYPPPPGPVTPELDAPQDGAQGVKGVMEKLRTEVDKIKTKKAEIANKVKSLGNFIGLDFNESPLKKEDNTPTNPVMKELTASVDLKDETAVSQLFQELFLTYPMDLLKKYPASVREYVKDQYLKKQVEFANDNMFEIDVAVRALENDRIPLLKEELKSLSSCYVFNQGGTSASCESASENNEELGTYVNGYKLKKLRDSYLRIYEELIALKAQASVAMSLRDGVKPFNEEEANQLSSDQQSSLNIRHYEILTKMSFAQAQKKSRYELVKAPKYQLTTPFEGAEDQIQALSILEGIYGMLTKAQKLHNTKQQMPDLRGPFIEYEKMVRLHEKAIEKLALSESYVDNYMKRWYTLPDDFWFGNGCRLKKVHLGKRCASITGCSSNKGYEDYNRYMIACKNNTFEVEKYEQKGGASKDVISAYNLAKERIVFGVNENMVHVATPNLNAEVNVSDMTSSNPNTAGLLKGDSKLTDESLTSYASSETRVQGLIRWQVGNAFAKIVGGDTSGMDINIKQADNKYPLWKDEKLFYDQYIREKYKNMMLYFYKPVLYRAFFDVASKVNEAMDIDQDDVKRYDRRAYNNYQSELKAYEDSLEEDDEERASKIKAKSSELYSIYKRDVERYVEKLKEKLKTVKQNNRSVISKDLRALEKMISDDENNSPIKKLKSNFDEQMQRLAEGFHSKIEGFENTKAQLYEKMDEAKASMNENNKRHNTLAGEVSDAENQVKMQETSKKLAQEKKQKDPNYISKAENVADEGVAEQQGVMEGKLTQSEEALEDAENDRNNMLKSQELALKEDEKIAKAKDEYMKQVVDLEAKYFKDLNEALNARLAEINTFLSVRSKGDVYLTAVYDAAENMFKEFQLKGTIAVTTAYGQIMALGETRYNSDEYGKILNIHNNMINTIGKVSLPTFKRAIEGLVVSNVSLITSSAQLLQNAVFTSNCENIGCKNEDKVYHISISPRSRDFVAPKRASSGGVPPLREAQYFDSVDYDAINKTPKTSKTTRYEFLYGLQDAPDVWRRILSPDGFVEREVDVIEFLNGNDNQKGLMALVGDIKQRIENDAFLKAKGEKPANLDVGELSLFLKYDNGLTFTKSIEKLVSYFDPDKELDEDEAKEYTKRLLTRNQVGDYLMFVDIERIYQTNLDQLKVKMDETRKKIEEVLEDAYCQYVPKETGYLNDKDASTKIVSTEFISDEETYQAILKCLDEGKNLFVSKAEELEGRLPSELRGIARERKEKTDRMKEALQKDYDEFVSLSDNTEPDEALDSQIKQKRADRAAVDRYGSEAEAEFERQLEQFEEPFAANY